MPESEISIDGTGELTIVGVDPTIHTPAPFLLIRVICSCGWGQDSTDGEWMDHFKEEQAKQGRAR